VGETAADTAREVEQTRRQMEEKVTKLSQRAPDAARNLGKKLIFAGVSAAAVMLARKLVDRAWSKATGEPPPTKIAKRR
jgi:hypothetical protein